MEPQIDRVSAYSFQHTGVLGMKWGTHRSRVKQQANITLAKKALNYDIKSDKLNRKSEKYHANKDLESANKMAKKSANYSIKSEQLQKKANKLDNDLSRTSLEKRSNNLAYKSIKVKMKANRISKTKGYGLKAMNYSIKSDKVALKAANVRRRIANNKKYIALVNHKMSTLDKSTLDKVKGDLFAPMKSAFKYQPTTLEKDGFSNERSSLARR